jgi:hypothetical protein
VSDWLPAKEPKFWRLTIEEDEPLSRKLWGELVKLRAGYRCEACDVAGTGPLHGNGAHTTELVAHHIDGKGHLEGRFHHRLSNGRCLCHSCHHKEHGRMRRAARAAA